MLTKQPLIAVPMGDPAGIGPEIVLKALADPLLQAMARWVVIGDGGILHRAMSLPGMPRVSVHPIASARRARTGVINLMDLDLIDLKLFHPGEVSAMCGEAAYRYIAKAAELCLAGEADAVSTPPIHKEAFRAAKVPYIGHTEAFAALTHTPDPLTLFEVRDLRVFFLSRHVSLKAACDLVTQERITDYALRCLEALGALGIREGTLAIAGLNPHCGEHGLFGSEEERAIAPAVAALQAQGFDVAGPIGADSVFHQALRGRYAAVLSLYHDQGHIAAKTLDFERTVSITAGMPILRTSVDHGTAFDIAWQGIASPVSMMEALRLAVKYAPAFVRH